MSAFADQLVRTTIDAMPHDVADHDADIEKALRVVIQAALIEAARVAQARFAVEIAAEIRAL